MVSVIIPNYNHAAYLRQRIESVLNQTCQDMEIIILDDCSSDQSKDIIEKYRHHPLVSHIVYNRVNSGSTFKQWKKGLTLAKGNWIWIAESDDYCDNDFLESLLGIKNSNCLLRYCASIPVNFNGEQFPDMNYGVVDKNEYQAEEYLCDYFIANNLIINASCVIIEKNILDQSITSFVLNHRLFGDWLVWINALEKTDIFFLNLPKNYHRHHSGTVRNQLEKNYEELILFRKEVTRSLLRSSLKTKSLLVKINNKMLSNAFGLAACSLIKEKSFLKSLPFIIKATFNSGFTISYLKDAVYWALKANR